MKCLSLSPPSSLPLPSALPPPLLLLGPVLAPLRRQLVLLRGEDVVGARLRRLGPLEPLLGRGHGPPEAGELAPALVLLVFAARRAGRARDPGLGPVHALLLLALQLEGEKKERELIIRLASLSPFR